jgi:hypothetical protein
VLDALARLDELAAGRGAHGPGDGPGPGLRRPGGGEPGTEAGEIGT